jgi:hypothetical protein
MATPIPAFTADDIDAKTKEQFIEIIHEQMELIEDLMMDETLNDGAYLSLTNNLQRLYGFSDKMKRNAIYVVYERQVRRARQRREPREIPRNYEGRMRHGYVPCEFCGRLIVNGKSAMRDHQSREVCKRFIIEKRGAIHTKKLTRSDETGIETAYHIINDWCLKHIDLVRQGHTQPQTRFHPQQFD